jgi:hypothetical protein
MAAATLTHSPIQRLKKFLHMSFPWNEMRGTKTNFFKNERINAMAMDARKSNGPARKGRLAHGLGLAFFKLFFANFTFFCTLCSPC